MSTASSTIRIAAIGICWLLATVACAQSPGGGVLPQPIERYYFLLFTSQDFLKAPRSTHTWATMVRIAGDGIVEAPTISWLPVDLKVKPFHFTVEPGANLPLDFTIQWARHEHQQVTVWGPYEASPELYLRFIRRKEELESGSLGYQCLDFIGEAAIRRNGVNCVHALTPVHGLAPGDVLQRYGNDSGTFITHTLSRRGLIDSTGGHDWLLPPLGIDASTTRRVAGATLPHIPLIR